MLVGDLMLVMAGNPYYGAPLGRSTLRANFTVQVLNTTGTASMVVAIEHRNADDNAWTAAGAFAPIGANGVYVLDLAGLKELIRFRFSFVAGAATDGMYVYAAAPQWLRD
ncbi:MAG: hypothetical protein K8T90_18815 [Planctomycetes bacterium]|nr:hypothetical protein [Planctomycetota bacterium]